MAKFTFFDLSFAEFRESTLHRVLHIVVPGRRVRRRAHEVRVRELAQVATNVHRVDRRRADLLAGGRAR